MTTLTWAPVLDSHHWVVAALEKDLLETTHTPAELRADAERVRTEAAQAQANGGSGEAFLMYAANVELVAVERLAAA
jgi:hypothetical protein